MTSETHSEFAEPVFHEPTRLADRFGKVASAIFDAWQDAVARFEQHLKALRFVHVVGDAAYAANETARARARRARMQRSA